MSLLRIILTFTFTTLLISVSFAQQNANSAKGTLLVEVTGLPDDIEAEVWAVSQEAKQKAVFHPAVGKFGIQKLLPSNYTISAFNAPTKDSAYIASNFEPSNTIDISANKESKVTIEYVKAAILTLEVKGLPMGELSKLEIVDGTSGQKFNVCNGAGAPILLTLVPKYYAIVAQKVYAKGIAYEATQPLATVTLKGGEQKTVTLEYVNVGKADSKEESSSGC